MTQIDAVLEEVAEPGHARVLVVDDVEQVGVVFERALRGAGFEVERASDGAQALQRLAAQHFDAVLSDIGMPNVDGIKLLCEVRKLDLDVPVVLITGNPTVDTALLAIEYGALRYLRKPVEPRDLVAHMKRAVRLGRMARLKREALDLLGDPKMLLGDRAGLEVSFERALHGLWMAYQPIVSWSRRRLFAFEALLRSSHPALGAADAMLAAATRLDALPALGRAVRRHVGCTVGASEVDQVFVNLHPRDLLDDELFSPASPLGSIASRVVLEITERAPLSPIEDLEARITRLRAMGFRIALDDLGAGYAGLASIAQLEPDVMKIDMALVRNVDSEPIKRRLVAAMANLCREMDVLVVAEGVETPAERDALAELGCDLMQGHLFAKPDRPFPEARL